MIDSFQAENTLIRLGYNNQSTLSLGNPAEYDRYCKIMTSLSGLTGKGASRL